MRIAFLGTIGGAEPQAVGHHSSFLVEHGNRFYVFDAGEGCSRTAHLLGYDLTRIRAVFISHTHMDHIGGLANLLWDIRKVHNVGHIAARRSSEETLDVHIPNPVVWDAVMTLLRHTEGNFSTGFEVAGRPVLDGVIFDEDGMRVTALGNGHMPAAPDGSALSYSLRIDGEGASVVYSGDVARPEEIAPLLDQRCDLLLMETGHHSVVDVCEFARSYSRRIGGLCFTHNGREILGDREAALETARRHFGPNVMIAGDGLIVDPVTRSPQNQPLTR